MSDHAAGFRQPQPDDGATRRLLIAERAAAQTRLAALTGDFDGIVAAAGTASDDEHDPEGSTTAFERQHVASLIGQTRRRLADIDAALRRLEAGSYGRCLRCGQPIGAARLAARPAAATCIGCAAASR